MPGWMILAAAVLLPGLAQAAVLTVDTYSETNNPANVNYNDHIYAGPGATGDPYAAGAFLQGGKGKLTDGIVAVANFGDPSVYAFYGTPAFPYVGYLDVDPAFVFTFASPVTITSVAFAVDDYGGAWGVTSPTGAYIGGTLYGFTDPPGTDPFVATVSGLNITTGSVPITIMRGGQWTFVSEITFNGEAAPVPEPVSAALLGMGVLGLAGWRAGRRLIA